MKANDLTETAQALWQEWTDAMGHEMALVFELGTRQPEDTDVFTGLGGKGEPGRGGTMKVDARVVDYGDDGVRVMLDIDGQLFEVSVGEAEELSWRLGTAINKIADRAHRPPGAKGGGLKAPEHIGRVPLQPVKEPTEPYYLTDKREKREMNAEVARFLLMERMLCKINELVAAVNAMMEAR